MAATLEALNSHSFNTTEEHHLKLDEEHYKMKLQDDMPALYMKENELDIKESKEDAKKKRNSRKRNRCDMSPEELQRLRERERKAQQSRRDRIRAQKKQAQNWGDDIALDVLLEKKIEKGPSAVSATMVNMKSDSPRECVQDMKREAISPPLLKGQKFHKQNSLQSNDGSHSSGGYPEPPNEALSSDETLLRDDREEKLILRKYDVAMEELEQIQKENRIVGGRNYRQRNCEDFDYRIRSPDNQLNDPHSPYPHLSPPYSHYPPHVYESHHHRRYLREGRFLADLHYPQSDYTNHHYLNSSMEEKKMVSRNVDRKKLSEEELEDLRRRERDYQRERRARIRLEKAKSSRCDESIMRYYHNPPNRHHHYAQDSYHHTHSPPPRRYKMEADVSRDNYSPEQQHELSVSIPCERKPFPKETYYVDRDAELLQVVPKNRDYEEMKQSPPEFHSKSSSSDVNPVKKNALENICSSLKKESEDIWEEEQQREEDKMIVVQPSVPETDAAKNEMAKTKEAITDDQLERRRKSNREAQRRRRARLKMIEERPSSALDISGESTDSKSVNLNSSYEEERLSKKCRVKNTPSRPDSLYPEEFAYYPNDKYFGSVMKEIKTRNFAYDKYNDKTYRNHAVLPTFEHSKNSYYALPPSHYHHHATHRQHSPPHRHYKEHRFTPLHEKEINCLDTHRDKDHTPAIVINPTEIEKSRKSSRKQCAPRKVLTSVTTTPDEDVDVTNITPEFHNGSTMFHMSKENDVKNEFDADNEVSNADALNDGSETDDLKINEEELVVPTI